MVWEKTKKIQNGNTLKKINYYECDECKEEIPECYPHYTKENRYHLCLDCAFKKGKISEKFYLRHYGIALNNIHASVYKEKVIIHQGKPPWERGVREIRNSKKYSEWRTKVFERDNYTCQKCGQIGGELNAHHIKEFAKYPKLRFELDNGITLCKKCHKNKHWGDNNG